MLGDMVLSDATGAFVESQDGDVRSDASDAERCSSAIAIHGAAVMDDRTKHVS
jgi:hypothetical protein